MSLYCTVSEILDPTTFTPYVTVCNIEKFLSINAVFKIIASYAFR